MCDNCNRLESMIDDDRDRINVLERHVDTLLDTVRDQHHQLTALLALAHRQIIIQAEGSDHLAAHALEVHVPIYEKYAPRHEEPRYLRMSSARVLFQPKTHMYGEHVHVSTVSIEDVDPDNDFVPNLVPEIDP